MSTSIMDLVKKKKAALQASSGRREKAVKPQPGKNKFRILPNGQDEELQFWQDFGQHFIKDTNDGLKAVYMCTEKTDGKPCPICEGIAQGINEAGDDDVIGALKDSKASGRVLLNALHLDGDDANTPVILDLSPTTFEKVLELMEEYGNVTSLDEGIDIVINRSGKGLNTEYSVLPAAKSKPVDKAVLKNLHNLQEYVKQEWDEGRNKAISAVSNVSGLMLTMSDTPTTAALAGPSSADDEFDDYDTATPAPASSKADKVEVEVVAELDEAELDDTGAVATDEALSDAELDDMLASL